MEDLVLDIVWGLDEASDICDDTIQSTMLWTMAKDLFELFPSVEQEWKEAHEHY